MRNKVLTLTIIITAFILSLNSCSKDDDNPVTPSNDTEYKVDGNTVIVTDKGKGTGDYIWTADKVWILNGFVFVNDGQTLTIEAGTVIKGKPGEGETASALIVARGGKIMADGTKQLQLMIRN